jgi:uncharacterized protein (TIGR00661 family)
MRVLFIIQGEGRGHLTQAVSLKKILEKNNHIVCGVFIGKSISGEKPSFIEHEFNQHLTYFDSPSLVYRNDGNGLSIQNTLTENLMNFKTFYKSLRLLKSNIKNLRPDIIVNFYDILGGLFKLSNPFSNIPMVCIGHQYLMLHSSFKYPASSFLDRFLVNMNSRITAIGAKRQLALSLNPISSEGRIRGIAPLLRSNVKDIIPQKGEYYLAYLTNQCLLPSLTQWQKNNPEVEVHCFCKTDKKIEQPNFILHELNAQKFLAMMANAKGLVTSAGFESVCEAVYFGKPVFMVPVPNHFEQSCNAHEFYLYGAGLKSKTFQLDEFLNFADNFKNQSERFKNWCKYSQFTIIDHLEQCKLTTKTKKYTPSFRFNFNFS